MGGVFVKFVKFVKFIKFIKFAECLYGGPGGARRRRIEQLC